MPLLIIEKRKVKNMMTKEEVLASANDEQQEAIKHQEGACMIIAGPGSGK